MFINFVCFSSGTLDIEKLDELNGEGTNETGRWFFRLEDSPIAESPRAKCYRWYLHEAQPAAPPLIKWTEPCPCTMWQARRDRRFSPFFNPHFNENCYIRNRPRWSDGAWWYRQCCYSTPFRFSWRGFLTQSGYLHVWPGSASALGFITDQDAYSVCCIQSNLCGLFYDRRPPGQCLNYRLPRRRKSH